MSVNDSKDDPLIICSRGVVNLASQNVQRKVRTMIDQTVFSFTFIKHAIDDLISPVLYIKARNRRQQNKHTIHETF